MSKKLLALLLAMIMIVGSFTSVLAEAAKPAEDKKEETVKTEEKKDEKSEEKSEEKTEMKDEKKEEKVEEKVEEPKDELLARAIEVLKNSKLVEGFSKDSEDLKLEQNITRAQFAALLVRGFGMEASAKALQSAPPQFTDINYHHWANGYVAAAKATGVINGYPNGQFRPENQITYAEMAAMLVRVLKLEKAGMIYPAGYIMTAQQEGIFNGVPVTKYDAAATRADVFKMFYNTITNKNFGDKKVLKAIVLENSRVEKLAADEITVEVIDVVQKANWVGKTRTEEDKRGDQHTYKLTKETKRDVEQLLGKVVDITVDKADNVLEVVEDKAYTYVEGKIQYANRNKFKIAGSEYSVAFDERYDSMDERIYRTYLNNKNYTYRDFQAGFEKGKYDFARVTVKNGKVIFIDAYKFDDVAPVSKVDNGDVYYLDDARSAREYKAAALNSRVIFHDKNGYSVADIKDIVKGDVIHFYNDYTNAIVRKDAKVETELVKTHRDYYGKEFAVGKDAEYLLSYVKGFQAISSLEGKYFNVVNHRGDLDQIIKDNVTILLALDNTVQLIESAKEWKDGIHAVKRITSKGEVQLLPPRGDVFWAEETRDTDYIKLEDTVNNRRLLDFKYNDIVYYTGTDKNEIVKLGVVEAYNYYKDMFRNAELTRRYITSGKDQYRYFEGLNAYVLDDGELQQIKDFDKFYDDNKNNKELESYVISEAQLRAKLKGLKGIKLYNFLSNANDIASIVVFKNVSNAPKWQKVYALATDKWYNTKEARFEDASGKEYIVALYNGSKNFEEDDIVDLWLDKATIDKEDVQLAGKVNDVVIDAAEKKVKRSHIVKLRDTNTYEIEGERKYFDRDTKEFSRVSSDYAQVYYAKDNNKYVAVVRWLDAEGARRSEEVVLGKYSTSRKLVIDGKDEAVGSTVRYYVWNEKAKDYDYKGHGANGFEAIVEYLGGKFLVERDRNGEIVIVKAVKSPAQIRADEIDEELESAKAAIEALKPVEYAYGTTDQKAKFKAAAEAALKEKALDKKVEVAIEDKTADSKFEVTLTHKASTKDEKFDVEYKILTEQEEKDAAKKAEKAAKQAVLAEIAPNAPKTIKAIKEDGSVDKKAILDAVNQRLNAASVKYTVKDLTVKSATKKADTENVYEVEFDYDGETKVVELTLTK